MADKNAEFIGSLYEQHYERIYKLCCAKLGYDSADAKDCAQEVFAAALKCADKLGAHPDPERWLYKTAHNMIKRCYRTKRTLLLHEADGALADCAHSEDDGFEPYLFTEADIAVLREHVLDKLLPDERQLYEYVYEQKLGYAGAADKLGIKLSTVRMRIYRLNIRLHELTQNIFSG